MVKKYYFQSLNGQLVFVHYGTIEEVRAKVDSEFDGDKAEVLSKIGSDIADAQAKVDELESKINTLEKDTVEYYEAVCLLNNYKAGILKANAEIKRVQEQGKPDLAIFELTPIKL